MKRREAIRNLSLGIGYVVSAPVVMRVLESCSEPKSDWKGVFLDEKLVPITEHLVDIILPSSDIPGGLDLNLPQFVDKMCADVLSSYDKKLVLKGGTLFADQVYSATGEDASEANRKQVEKVFKSYFDLNPSDTKAVLEQQKKDAEEINEDELESFELYKFLFTIREFALLGYFTSEKIGKEYLVFDPIPSGYKPCIPLSDVGNAWTIG
jgi:hypothetical protein